MICLVRFMLVVSLNRRSAKVLWFILGVFQLQFGSVYGRAVAEHGGYVVAWDAMGPLRPGCFRSDSDPDQSISRTAPWPIMMMELTVWRNVMPPNSCPL
jgi:hypothetical protein